MSQLAVTGYASLDYVRPCLARLRLTAQPMRTVMLMRGSVRAGVQAILHLLSQRQVSARHRLCG